MAHLLERDLNHVLAHTTEIWDGLRGGRLFITGGSGFVGTWLLETFAWANDNLKLDAKATVLTRNPGAFLVKAPYAAEHPSIDLLRGDMQSVRFPAGPFRYVIHAATDQAAANAKEPGGTFERELSGTRRVLEFASSCGVKRLLFTSSGAVYGPQPSGITHVSEEYIGAPSPVEAASAYGEAKRASEFLCAAYARQFDFAAILARLFAFSGPYLPLHSNFAIGNFVRDALAGGPIKIAGDGTPFRSYLYAADLAIWLWHLLLRGESARPYNVGSAQAITIRELAERVRAIVAPDARIEIAQRANPSAPVARYVPCVDRARNELGLREFVPLDEQIRRMFEWNRRRVSSP